METRQEEPRQPKKRSIDFLTPDQLRRKREGNVRAQRALREKRKAEMQALQDQNRDLENRLRAAQAALTQAQEQARGQGLQGLNLDPRNVGIDATAPALQLMLGSDMAMPFVPWGENEITSMDVLQIMDDSSDMWTSTLPAVTDLPGNTPDNVKADADTPGDSPHVPSIPPSVPFTTIATDQVWSIIPKHTAPVCVLDDALLTLIHQRRPKDNAPEFQKNSFPSVQSLLNSPPNVTDPDSPDSATSLPEHIEDPRFPVSSTIVHNLRHIMTVPGLPEQIAMLQNVSAIVRWLIAPTRANYEAMPLYLRPTATQLVVPHPPWIDVMPWAAARDWFCSSPSLASLANYNLFSTICNETLCLNWPFQDADILLHCTSFASRKPKEAVDEILLNPIFDRHIKDAANWTVGSKIFKV
ncbi:hypothetical protein Sste5346_006454 [Sporothrix stenoceras]|uniref:BZIP domain-containing protein n=1 Tax=Sporothrix stenoceras TaxID=5173 RepID=A0ABR3YZW9_9PEZI